ncbi:MAG: dipeptide epimerase [Alphaproteobacteria bacterium]|nr:dipeptide epimerase [Alphaproteobacteria bacterium]
MPGLKLSVQRESFKIAGTFTISRGSRTQSEVVLVELSDGSHVGRGECVPYKRYGETVDGVIGAIEALRNGLMKGLNRTMLQSLAKPGAARNAIDCALWDLEAKRAGKPAWQIAGLPAPRPLTTAYTLSLDTPDAMAAKAAENGARPVLKMKLAGDGDLARVEAVRKAAPKAKVVVDANEGWSAAHYDRFAPELAKLGVAMIEQPLPAGEDEALRGRPRPVPLCADESCHDRSSLERMKGKYDFANIKLDKTGGLTEALALKAAAEAAGFRIMVGCMIGTSLAMAPAFLAAQGAEIVDLDGPLLLAEDRPHAIRYDGSLMHAPDTGLWG